jgi:4-hydroxybenzoyl-CoA reductase subunit beta
MLRLPPFRLLQPRTVADAAAMLTGEGPDARVVAGGTDLWPNMKRRHQKAATVVSLMGIPELAGIHDGGAEGAWRLGATTRLADLEAHPELRARYPSLARAVASISSPPLRQMGTLGGNLCVDTRCTYYNQTEEWRASIDYCMKEEGTICWVATSSPRCWAHSASDGAPMLQALGAEVRLVSAAGERQVPIAALYRDDGIDYLAKRPEEIAAEVVLPAAAAAPRCRSAFWKLRRRGSIDFAVLSAAVALWLDGETIERADIVLGAVGSAPRPAEEAAAFLTGKRADSETLAEAARLARKVATPMDNTDFQAQWRKAVAGKYVEAALREAAGLEPGLLPPRHPVA